MTEVNERSSEVEQLRAGIEETRAEMAETVETIEQRLRPSKIGQRLVRRAQQVPAVPVIGAGLGSVTLATVGAVARRSAARRAEVRLERRRTADQAIAISSIGAIFGLVALGRGLRRRRTVNIP